MTAKTSISLTDEQDAYARSLVESGQYPSLSAVLRRGLDMLRRESEMRDAELEALRSLIDRRRAGAFVDIDVGEAETRAMLTRKRKALICGHSRPIRIGAPSTQRSNPAFEP